MDLQLQVFEEALAALEKPRVVLLDTIVVPCFDPATRGITLGWDLTIRNRAQLRRENPLDL